MHIPKESIQAFVVWFDMIQSGSISDRYWIIYIHVFIYVYIQGVLLPDRQTSRGESRHENKHY